jgi:hypothetical protein
MESFDLILMFFIWELAAEFSQTGRIIGKELPYTTGQCKAAQA